MTFKPKHLLIVISFLLANYVVDALAGGGPPTANRCGRGWRFNAISNDLAFGQFSIDSGGGGVNMSSGGARTPVGDVGLASGLPFNAYQVEFDNRRGAACLGFPFDIEWRRSRNTLTGPGADLPLNIYVYEPTIAPGFGTTLPISVPANSGLALPFIVTFYGDISATFPQTAGDYRSRNMRFQVVQGGRNKRGPRFRATATSIVPMTLIETFPMDFGTVAGGSLPGTVILNTSGARTTTGDGQILAVSPGTAAAFQLTGSPGLAYVVSFPATGILESLGGQQVTITNFTDNSLGTVPAAGIENFQVGATLNLNPLQPAGTYSTTTGGGVPYTITVNYN